MLRPLLALLLVTACSRPSSPGEGAQSAPGPGSLAATDAAPRTAATRPAQRPTDAAQAAEPAGCERDDDCVLTTYQAGCCVQACESYAMDKRRLAAARAKEDCSGQRGEDCPPPAPCPPPTHRVVAARCNAGECVAEREPLPK